MNFAIIGSGMIARFHAEAISNIQNATLVGVYSRNQASARDLANTYNCLSFKDLDQLLSLKSLDIVTIATPSGAHLYPVLKAADYGKHIICEKPLEINVPRIQQMIEHCQNKDVLLSGIFNRRFNKSVELFKKAIDKGRFGQITLCEASIKWYRTQEYYDSGSWRGTRELDGGGALMNQGIHTIDLLIYLVGPVKRVSATMASLIHQNIEVEDTAVAILEFKNGARGVIQGSTACWSSSGHPAEIQICGEFGSVYLADEHISCWDFKFQHEGDKEIQDTIMNVPKVGLGANDPAAINTRGHEANFLDVMEAIQNNRKPKITGEEALKAVQLINAIYQSAKNEGEWINL